MAWLVVPTPVCVCNSENWTQWLGSFLKSENEVGRETCWRSQGKLEGGGGE